MRIMEREEARPIEWARAKQIRILTGISAPQLMRYAQDGLVRTSHIRRPGQTRGVRLFHLGDIRALIEGSVESSSVNLEPESSDE